MTESKKDELRMIASNQLEDPIIVIAYLEHQMDLMARIILDLAENVNSLTEEQKQRVEMLKGLMNHSSIDFNDLDNPLHAYKIPKTIENKEYTRLVQYRYLQAQIKEGIFGK